MVRVFRPEAPQIGELPDLDPNTPRICSYRKCLNTALPDSNLCESCHEKLGIAKSRKVRNQQWALAGLLAAKVNRLYVYCIQCGDGGPIKIGKTHDVGARLATLQTSSPYKLALLGQIPAHEKLEEQLHAYLDEYRMEGEWFRPESDVLDIVRMVTNGRYSQPIREAIEGKQ